MHCMLLYIVQVACSFGAGVRSTLNVLLNWFQNTVRILSKGSDRQGNSDTVLDYFKDESRSKCIGSMNVTSKLDKKKL